MLTPQMRSLFHRGVFVVATLGILAEGPVEDPEVLEGVEGFILGTDARWPRVTN